MKRRGATKEYDLDTAMDAAWPYSAAGVIALVIMLAIWQGVIG